MPHTENKEIVEKDFIEEITKLYEIINNTDKYENVNIYITCNEDVYKTKLTAYEKKEQPTQILPSSLNIYSNLSLKTLNKLIDISKVLFQNKINSVPFYDKKDDTITVLFKGKHEYKIVIKGLINDNTSLFNPINNLI